MRILQIDFRTLDAPQAAYVLAPGQTGSYAACVLCTWDGLYDHMQDACAHTIQHLQTSHGDPA